MPVPVPVPRPACTRTCCNQSHQHYHDADHVVIIGRNPDSWEVVVEVLVLNAIRVGIVGGIKTVWTESSREAAFQRATGLISDPGNSNFRLNFYESRVKESYDVWSGAREPLPNFTLGNPEFVGALPQRLDVQVGAQESIMTIRLRLPPGFCQPPLTLRGIIGSFERHTNPMIGDTIVVRFTEDLPF